MRLPATLIGLVVFVSTATAAPPGVVRTEPAHRAASVNVDVGVVRLVFDRDMNRSSFTLYRVDDLPFPPFEAAANRKPWVDARTFEWRIGRLEPGRTYGVQLNGARRRGFRSAEGRAPLPITRLVFTVAGARPAAPSENGAPVGTWVETGGRIEVSLTLAPDGTFAQSVRMGATTSRSSGRYTVEGDRLILTETDGEARRYLWRLEAGRLHLKDEDGDSTVLREKDPGRR